MADSTDNEEFIDIDPKDLDRMLDVESSSQLSSVDVVSKWPKSSIWGLAQSSSFLSPLMAPRYSSQRPTGRAR